MSNSAIAFVFEHFFKIAILHDLDTMTETISEDIELIIYGCGDGICESDYENTLNCSDDCN